MYTYQWTIFKDQPNICFWKYSLKQSKTFVLHQNQVSSCKGYGYWFKKFKDFPSQSSDGAPSFWSLFVATFRPTLDSTFNIITTRLEPAGPTGAKCTQSHFLVLMTPSCWLWSISISLSVVDRRQHVASDPLRCSKASLNLLGLPSSGCSVCNQLEAADVRSRCSLPSPSPLIWVLCSLAWKSNQHWSHCCSENLGITKIRKLSLHLAGELILVFSITGGKQLSSDNKALLLFMELWEGKLIFTWN